MKYVLFHFWWKYIEKCVSFSVDNVNEYVMRICYDAEKFDIALWENKYSRNWGMLKFDRTIPFPSLKDYEWQCMVY